MANLWWFSCLLFVGCLNIISAQCQIPSYYGQGYGSPYPVVIGNKGNDDLKYILPILMLLLNDGDCGGGCGGGCCCGCCDGCGCSGSTMVPIPYPIPIPVNCPVLCN